MKFSPIAQPDSQLMYASDYTASRIHSFVERLFETAPDRHSQTRENPVTGSHFMSGLDPIGPQKEAARRALAAKWQFGTCKPGDAPDLPVDPRKRSQMKFEGPLHWLVAEFAGSLARNDYDFRKHPALEDYARGVMASSLAPDFIKKNPELLRRFPPKPLKGLGRGMVWQPAC